MPGRSANWRPIFATRENTSRREKRFREALALRRASQLPHHPGIAATLVGLPLNQIEQGKPEEAGKLLLETLEIRKEIFAPTADQFAESYRYLGRALNNGVNVLRKPGACQGRGRKLLCRR